MSSIISLDGNCETLAISNVISMFSNSKDARKIDAMARELGTVQRQRQFYASDYIATGVAFSALRGKAPTATMHA